MKLIVKKVSKNFKKKPVLTDMTYTFESNTIYGLLGKNGAGKTIFFNILYNELDKDAGEFFLEEDGEEKPISFDDIGMVFAENILPDFLTAYEYIKFIGDINEDKMEYSIDEYFDMVDINEVDRHRLMKNYSSGMKSKVSLLGMYIQRPKVILLDEPLTAVDVISGEDIKKFIKEMKKDHIIIISTHMMALAKDICDEIVLLNEGRLYSLDNLMKDDNFEEKIIEALKETNNAEV